MNDPFGCFEPEFIPPSLVTESHFSRNKASESPIKGFIWPRDPYPGPRGRSWFRNRVSAWHDVLTGKGPDIFIGRLDNLDHRPSRARWSRWSDLYPDWDDTSAPPFWGAYRGDKRYNFRTRRYEYPHTEMWSDVGYCQRRKHKRIPIGFHNFVGMPFSLMGAHVDADGFPACWK